METWNPDIGNCHWYRKRLCDKGRWVSDGCLQIYFHFITINYLQCGMWVSQLIKSCMNIMLQIMCGNLNGFSVAQRNQQTWYIRFDGSFFFCRQFWIHVVCFFFRKSVGKKFCKRQIYPNTLKTLEIFADGRSRFLYITHHYPNLGCGFNGFFGTFATKIASVNFPN